jgi:hypothetical protein
MLKFLDENRVNQAHLVEWITGKGIYGLGKTTLDTRFSDANEIFNEKLKDSKQCTQKN